MEMHVHTLELLETIAAANGVAVDDFLVPQRDGPGRIRPSWGRPCRAAAMLTRFCKAYLALPEGESRLRAVRMMEAMAERARSMR